MATTSKPANALTQFFGEVVAELARGLAHLDGGDETAWEISRRLHAVWRAAIRRTRGAEAQEAPEAVGHPAFTELKRLVDLEVEE